MIPTKILSILLQDGKGPMLKLGRNFPLRRYRSRQDQKMIDAGVITGSHIEVDYKSLGYDITAFWAFTLKNRAYTVRWSKEWGRSLRWWVPTIPPGNYGIFAKIIVRDTDHLRDVLSNKIQKIKGIQRTKPLFLWRESIRATFKRWSLITALDAVLHKNMDFVK